MLLYKVMIDAVDGESFYEAGGPDRAPLLAFLHRYDHEGSTVTLEWWEPGGAAPLGFVADPERVCRILEELEDPTHG